MIHRGCGGLIVEDWSKTYPYTTDNGLTFHQPSYRCRLCATEIVGDPEIEEFEDHHAEDHPRHQH